MKASIILNGNSNGTMYITGELIVACDGGAEELRRRGIVPHVLIGDMDSISDDTLEYFESKGVKIQVYPHEKDETDFELALNYIFKHGATEVEILNWQGERIDMILAMIGLMSKYDNVTAISDNCEVGVIRAGENSDRTLKAIHGEIWSFIPLCSAEFSIEGFKYKFDGNMEITSPIGVSNIALNNEVKVNVRQGKVVYVRWKKRPL
ncbi:MAG: thiamine diphosphokinase [Fervidobacterium gondwanense]